MIFRDGASVGMDRDKQRARPRDHRHRFSIVGIVIA
jgi:hypothetical protein